MALNRTMERQTEDDKSSCVCFQPLFSVIRQTTYRGAHGYGEEVS